MRKWGNQYQHSRRVVLKIHPKTGEIVHRYPAPCIASQLTGISQSNINKALKGVTRSAGGWCWCYEDEYDKFELPDRIYVSETARIDRILGLR